MTSPAIARDDLPPSLPRARAWAVVSIAVLAMTVSYVDRQALAALAPTVTSALGIDHTRYGWLTSAFSFAYLVGAPLGGVLVDRVGARRGLAGSLAAWSLIAAAHAAAPSFGALLALRVLLGLAEAPSFPGAAQTVRRVLDGGARDAGLGMIFTGSSVGAMIAGPITVALHMRFGWRAAFVGVAFVGLAWLPAWLTATRGAAGERLGARLPGLRATDASSAGDAFVALGELARMRMVMRSLVLIVTSAPAFMFGMSWFPLYLAGTHRISQAHLGAYVWVPPLLFDFGAIGFGAIATHVRSARGPRALVAVSGLLVATLAVVPAADAAGAGPWVATTLVATALAGVGALFSVVTGDMIARVDPARVSRVTGLAAAAQSLAHIVAGPVVGRAVDRAHGYAGVLPVLGLLAIPGAILWITWPDVEPRRDA